MMFTCLPPPNDNEWLNLKEFVNQYNIEFGTNYKFASSPEQEDSTNPQPEVMLQDDENMMVIERKIFPWPHNHVRNHQLWHELSESFFKQLEGFFTDNLYVLEIHEKDIPTSKRDAIATAKHIAQAILSYRSELAEGSEVYDSKPIPWRFSIVPLDERDEDDLEYGVGVRLRNALATYDPEDLNSAKHDIKIHLERLYERTILKFAQYKNCLKVLVIELYTDLFSLSNESLEKMIMETKIPNLIDQIWLAELVEPDDQGEMVIYRQVGEANHT